MYDLVRWPSSRRGHIVSGRHIDTVLYTVPQQTRALELNIAILLERLPLSPLCIV